MSKKEFTKEELEEIKTIKVGKWDIISEYSRIDWINKGHTDEESMIHGIVIAVVGYQSRLGKKGHAYTIEQKGKEKGVSMTHRGKDKWITTKDFDKIITKIGKEYYERIFSPAIKNLYEKGYSYDQVKKVVEIPSTIGAKITLDKLLPFLK